VRLEVRALSLNYRDLLVIRGQYNPRMRLPAVPISDAAGVVAEVGPAVRGIQLGDAMVTHFVAGWIDGPFRSEYVSTTLGTPGPGMAAEQVVLPAEALVPIPPGYDFAQAATWPIAALTAWSALVTEGHVEAGQTVLTLGTGGVSIFALQFAKAFGARVIITSRSDEKLRRARACGADVTINYQRDERWERRVLKATDGRGADLVVETGGIRTLAQSLRATRPGGTVAMLGAMTGLRGEVDIAPLIMRRIRVAGILVGSRVSFEDMLRFVKSHRIEAIIDRRFTFDNLADALRYMESGQHFGKIVVEF